MNIMHQNFKQIRFLSFPRSDKEGGKGWFSVFMTCSYFFLCAALQCKDEKKERHYFNAMKSFQFVLVLG